MATRAVLFILPLAGLITAYLGIILGLGPLGLLALYSGIGQVALFGVMAFGLVTLLPNRD